MEGQRHAIDVDTIPEEYRASYANVRQHLDGPLAQLEISEIRISAIFNMQEELFKSTPVSAEWRMHLLLPDATGLVLYMHRAQGPGRRGRAPGVLDVEHVVQGAREWVEGRDCQFSAEVEMAKNGAGAKRPFRVREFLQFLLDERLLRYTFEVDPETHPFYWLQHVLYRLVLAGRLAGGTSRLIVMGIEGMNRRLSDAWRDIAIESTRGRPPPQIDAEVMSKPGTFT